VSSSKLTTENCKDFFILLEEKSNENVMTAGIPSEAIQKTPAQG
jgi:hypothetical protein